MSETTYERAMHRLADDRIPTSKQREVIEFEDAAIPATAGAGLEKTVTMVNRTACHVVTGRISPKEVPSLTFTCKAADELSQHVSRALGRLRAAGMSLHTGQISRPSLARPAISTYNALASGVAAPYGMLVGADPAARFVTDAEWS